MNDEALPCARCGYDVRSQERDGQCPECGYPVKHSVGQLDDSAAKHKPFDAPTLTWLEVLMVLINAVVFGMSQGGRLAQIVNLVVMMIIWVGAFLTCLVKFCMEANDPARTGQRATLTLALTTVSFLAICANVVALCFVYAA